MNFALLVPAALGLGLLLAGPILAHLAQQRPSQRQAFGAMLLLDRLVRRLEKKRRLKDLLLLLLRLLVLAGLIIAAMRPELYWPGDAPSLGGSGRVVIVLDDSMSMALEQSGRSLHATAQKQALEQLKALPPGTQVGLVKTDGVGARVFPALETETSRIASAIQASRPGYGRTDLSGALREARGLLEGEPGEILVYTDEAGPGVIEGASGELRRLIEKGSSVLPRPVHADPPRNVAVLSARYGDGLEGGTVEVEFANYGEDAVKDLACTVTLPDDSEITAFVDIEAEGRTTEFFTVPRTVPGGVASVWVRDPAMSRDDKRYFHLPRVGASRVMVVDGDPGVTPIRSEVYFLERALAPWGGKRGGVLPEVVSPAGLGGLDPAIHRVVFVANVSDPTSYADKLVDFVRAGGSVVLSMGDNVTASRYNAALRDILPATLRRTQQLVDLGVDGGVPLELPDLAHPLFAPFSRNGRLGFREIETRRIISVEPFTPGDAEIGPRTILRYEGGMPALIEQKFGQGRVLLWTSTFDLGWTDAPVEAVYMPFVQRIVGYLGGQAGGGAERVDATVGEDVTIELAVGELEPLVYDPDGGEVLAELYRGEKLIVRFTPQRPGAWSVGIPDEPPLALVAVNVPPEESDVRRGESLAEAEADIDPEALRQTLELGRLALGFALFGLIGQALLAAREIRE